MWQQILNYWYDLEFFNPCYPISKVDKNTDTDLAKKDLPWLKLRSKNVSNIRVSYDVYFCKAHSNDLIAWMLDSLNLCAEGETMERDSSSVCLCALKVDEAGAYVANSFVISGFVWAVCKLIETGSFSTKLNISELEKLQEDIDQKLINDAGESHSPISKDILHSIYKFVCEKINMKQSLFDFNKDLWSREKIQYANKNGEFPPLDPSTELLSSYYLEDMKKVLKSPTSKIKRYVQSMEPRNEVRRIQIDIDVLQMRHWSSAEYFPLGAWPSRYSPSLMQQMGINLAISGEQDIFSINGPPGTGKTTLLKEIVASNVVQRAIVMASYDSPEDAFNKREFENPPDLYNKSFYELDQKLSAYGIIVASNNNAAVENISLELPKMIAKDRTGRFSNAENTTESTYFSDIATALSGEPAWGLISARLGKKSNLNILKERLWWKDDGITLKHYYDQGIIPEWNAACKSFYDSYKNVKDKRKDIEKAQSRLAKHEKARVEFSNAHTKYDESLSGIHQQKKVLSDAQKELERLEKELVLHRKNIVILKSTLPFLMRIFWRLFKKNPIVEKWKQAECDEQKTVTQIADQTTVCQTHENVVQNVLVRHKSLECELRQTEKNLSEIEKRIVADRKRFGDNWAGDAFWENISINEQSQTSCPWVDAEYDKTREELFYQALMLHKAFVLSCNGVKQNLMRLFAMWDGKFTAEDRATAYGDLLNTLLLVIPVISTTFASVQAFLGDMRSEELGILVVDEAGQATPQSALGALWRAQEAIIVGDPLQVEPIVTIPAELRKRLADENKIQPIYRLPELSVQMLADQLNMYGGARKLPNDDEIWVGCPLVVHRRCIEPMFQISNEVAYNGRMFNKTIEPNATENFLLPKSQWFDIKGREIGNKNHAVHEQINCVINLIGLHGDLPDLYIITPFTSVNAELKRALRPLIESKLPQGEENYKKANDWLNQNCGTIHTFQGKEANEVLLVLGCDASSGKSAAQWVGQKPNIINVAVSRAKYRLGIIGDRELWQRIPNVKIACEYLAI
jgi:hypothetical protein